MGEGLLRGGGGATGVACVSANVCAGRVTRPLVTHPGPSMGRSGTYTPMEGQKWQGLHVCSKPPRSRCFHSLSLFVVLWRSRRGKEKETVGGISVKLGR